MSGLSRRSAVRLTEKQLTEQKATILSNLEQKVKEIAGAKKQGESNTKEIKETLNHPDYSSYAIIVYEEGNKNCAEKGYNYKVIIKLPKKAAIVACFNHDEPNYATPSKTDIKTQFESDLRDTLGKDKGLEYIKGLFIKYIGKIDKFIRTDSTSESKLSIPNAREEKLERAVQIAAMKRMKDMFAKAKKENEELAPIPQLTAASGRTSEASGLPKAGNRKSRKGKKAGRKGSKRLGKKAGKTSQKPRRGKKASKHRRRA
jgi:hypothetical protein